MEPEVRTLQVSEMPIAVVTGRATRQDLVRKIRQLFDEFYQHVASVAVGRRGLNIIVYRGQPGVDLMETPEGMPLEIGVQVPAPFAGDGKILCSSTPAGRVATITHIGPYDQMRPTYDVLKKWGHERGESFAGPSWEVYGHWSDDPAQLRTDIYFLLK